MSLRVVCVVDKEGTALDRLAKGVIPYNQNLDYIVCDVHPKRADPQQLERFVEAARTADVIDAQYYRSMDMLRERYPWLRDIPTILTHNNPYAIHERDWNDYQVVVANNKTMYEDLKKITTSRLEYIPLVVDPLFWQFNDEYKFEKSVIMVANRIESKKGILPVAQACKELGIKMYLVGAISQPDYWQEVMDTGVVHFAQQCTDEELRDLYYKAGVHICNSVDNFESGTLPILEAIFCGVPVISRKVGHVPDILDEDNIIINDHDPEDVEHLTNLIRDFFSTGGSGSTNGALYNKTDIPQKIQDMRNKAWLSIKDRSFERRAYMYQKLYRELLSGEPVSVIVPVAGKEEVTRENLNAIANQTHQNIEIIVTDDGDVSQEENIQEFAKTVSIPVRYIRIGEEGYNLAKARNLAAIEATSDTLVFCDQRMIMDSHAIEEFLKELKQRTWLYGNKGAKKDWLENFSCVGRYDFFSLGGFNERLTMYGGLSQDMRARARRNAFDLKYVETAKAEPKGKSSNRNRKKQDIMAAKNILWKAGLL